MSAGVQKSICSIIEKSILLSDYSWFIFDKLLCARHYTYLSRAAEGLPIMHYNSQNHTDMEKLDFIQLNDQALSCEQAESCMGGAGGAKILTVDLEGL